MTAHATTREPLKFAYWVPNESDLNADLGRTGELVGEFAGSLSR